MNNNEFDPNNIFGVPVGNDNNNLNNDNQQSVNNNVSFTEANVEEEVVQPVNPVMMTDDVTVQTSVSFEQPIIQPADSQNVSVVELSSDSNQEVVQPIIQQPVQSVEPVIPVVDSENVSVVELSSDSNQEVVQPIIQQPVQSVEPVNPIVDSENVQTETPVVELSSEDSVIQNDVVSNVEMPFSGVTQSAIVDDPTKNNAFIPNNSNDVPDVSEVKKGMSGMKFLLIIAAILLIVIIILPFF